MQKVSRREFDSSKLLADKDTIPHMLDYLNKIGCFKHIFGDIAPELERQLEC
jgi:hypothetical protein